MTALRAPLLFSLILSWCILLFEPAHATQASQGWKRINGSSISLKGEINEGSFKQFVSVFDESVKHVILDSRGGDTYEALQIGRVLTNADITIFVRGFCMSSCANYLFLAGKKKIIENGIVGFHGNTTALIEEIGGINKAVSSVFPSSHRIQLNAIDFQRRVKKTMQWEKEFYEGLGIPQDFFTLTQLPDKGSNDGKSYDYLLPNWETFKKYNIGGVLGDHSKDWIQLYLREEKNNGREDSELLIESSN